MGAEVAPGTGALGFTLLCLAGGGVFLAYALYRARRAVPSVVRMLAMGALTWVAEWYDPDGDMTPDDIADELMRVLTKGIAK